MRRAVLIATAALSLGAVSAALANDGVAETSAGGLVLKQTDDIDMLSEDLYVSARQVRVRYVFRNQRPQDVRVTVAFPMPDRDLSELRYESIAYPADFTTRVDGQPVRMQVERKAMARGVDQSRLLESLGIPIVMMGESDELSARFERLRPEQRRQLIDLGLIEGSDYDMGHGMRTYYEPTWTVKETWYWEQVFPAGRDLVVEHEYTPGTGVSVGTSLAFPDFRDSEDNRRTMTEFCVDRDFLAAVDRMSGRSTREEPALLGEQRIRYVLTTGAGWRSPIGDFRLVVDKGRPENIVSFCEEGVRRISPTQFEVRHRNWRPTRDLAVLIVQPHRDVE